MKITYLIILSTFIISCSNNNATNTSINSCCHRLINEAPVVEKIPILFVAINLQEMGVKKLKRKIGYCARKILAVVFAVLNVEKNIMRK